MQRKSRSLTFLFNCSAALLICNIANFAQTPGKTESRKEVDFVKWIESQDEATLRSEWKKAIEQGGTSLDRSNADAATNYFTKAHRISTKLNDNILIAKSLHSLGKVEHSKGDIVKTRSFYEGSKSLLESTEEKEGRLAFGYLQKDFSNLLVLERQPQHAIEAAMEAWQIAENLSQPDLLAAAASALGAGYYQDGKFIRAISWFEKSLEIASKFKNSDSFLLGDVLLRLSYAYRAQGDYSLALQTLRDAEAKFRKLNQPSQNLRIWRAFADLYSSNGETEEAVRYLKRTCSSATELGLLRRSAQCQSELGLIQLWRHNFTLAEAHFLNAEKTASEIGANDILLRIFVGRAFLLGMSGQFQESSLAFEKARELASEKGDWTDQLRLNWLESLVFIEKKELAHALESADRAMALAEQYRETSSIPFLLELRGKILLALNRNKEARTTFNRAIDLIEQGRIQIADAALSVSFLGERSESYRNLLDLEIEESSFSRAFIVSEMLKSRWLADRSTELPNSTFTDASSWQRSDESKELRRRILAANILALASDPNGIQKLEIEEREYQKKVDQMLHPFSDRLVLKNALFTEEKLIGLAADTQSTILSYSVTKKNRVVVFIVNKDGLKAIPLSVDYPALIGQIRRFRHGITQFEPHFKQTGNDLYRVMVEPIEREISRAKNLVIVPDLGIWELPFQALINSEGQYLIEKYNVSYVPSPRFLLEERNSDAGDSSFLGFGNSITALAKPLKEAEREVISISKLYNQSVTHVERRATEYRFKREAPTARLIHLAVHGEIDPEKPFESALLLTNGSGDDGRLTVAEILRLPKLPHSLVVLSGCDTSNGKFLTGEGLLSLSWAFLAAGSRFVVAAQWAVEERSTADLMIDFHRNLLEDDGNVALALQQAQIKALKRVAPFNHPFYWSGFVAVGSQR